MKKMIPSVIALLPFGTFVLGLLDPEGFCASFFREYGMFELGFANVLTPFVFSFIAILFLYKYFDSPKECANLKPFFAFFFFTPVVSVAIIILLSFISTGEDIDSEPSKLEYVFAFISTLIYFVLFIPIGRHVWSKGSLVHYPYFGRGA
ncbi:hypothetical protein R83H12_02349 [Fibrobacteria bacterium R8-3-H12]